jgi:hypothetical protein
VYAKPSRKNFLEAVVDYAMNGGDATVALVNYGNMDEGALVANVPSTLQEAWAKVGHRISLIGGFRPQEAKARERFESVSVPSSHCRP